MPSYFGNDTSQINTPMLNYLAGIRARTGSNALRVRVGGNSMDDSPYITQASSPMVELKDLTQNANDQSVTYNSMVWKVMAQVAQSVDGIAYMIGVPLAVQPNASIVTDATSILGSSLDGMLLGNEPDLYTGHGKRPNLKNYTVDDYFGDYHSAINMFEAADNNGLKNDIGGPSICCQWDLRTLLQQGYISNFTSTLKYISLQHYPQNNCFGKPPYAVPWYLQHSNVVKLATWQKPGIDYLLSQPDPRPELTLSEFNSASCGGIPGLSDTFAVGSLWSIDYALQLASVGYDSIFIHTREPGISYNLLSPPAGVAGAPGAWTTNPPYYSLLVMAEALLTDKGGIVMDLNLGNSMTDVTASSSAYAVYNAGNHTVSRLMIFNYGNTSTEFSLPASVFSASSTALVKFLAAATPSEKTDISWGGETWGPGVADGKTTLSPSWAVPNQNLTGCSNGCSFTAPGPSLSVVFLDNAQSSTIIVPTPTNPSNDSPAASSNSKGKSNAMTLDMPLTTMFGSLLSLVSFAFLS